MNKVKVSRDYRIVIPAEARKLLGIKPGDNLLMDVRDDSIVLTADARDPVSRMLGLHKEIWEGIDAQEYVNELRGEWDESDNIPLAE